MRHDPADVPPRRRVLAIGVDPEQRVALLNQLNKVTAVGGEAFLLVPDAADWTPVHHKIVVISLAGEESTSGPNRLIRLPLTRWLALVLAGRCVVRPGNGSRLLGAALLAVLVRAPALRRAPWFDRWLRSSLYRDLRPWVLWRAARHHLDVIDPATLDEVLHRDPACWSVSWQLTRINPAIRVVSSPDADALAAFAVARQAWLKAHGIREQVPLRRRVRRMVGSRLPARVRRRLARKATPAA